MAWERLALEANLAKETGVFQVVPMRSCHGHRDGGGGEGRGTPRGCQAGTQDLSLEAMGGY